MGPENRSDATYLYEECDDVADDENTGDDRGFNRGVLCSDLLHDEAAVYDIIEGEKCSWGTDKEKLHTRELEYRVWIVFDQYTS